MADQKHVGSIFAPISDSARFPFPLELERYRTCYPVRFLPPSVSRKFQEVNIDTLSHILYQNTVRSTPTRLSNNNCHI